MDRVQTYDGSYRAGRAAALSGVPLSTIYNWARKGVVVPTVSPEREKLWSYADLMALRIVSWLRHPKEGHGDDVPTSPMGEVRRALGRLGELGLDIWRPGPVPASPLLVDRSGRIYLAHADELVEASGQKVLSGDLLDLLAPFQFQGERSTGPDLRLPRPHLRIVPNKCAGEPHLCGSRMRTLTVSALAGRGYEVADIARLYPEEDPVAIAEALELEASLAGVAQAA